LQGRWTIEGVNELIDPAHEVSLLRQKLAVYRLIDTFSSRA